MAEIIKDLAPAPARMSDEHLAHFENNGYVAFRDVISASDVEGIREAMDRVCLNAFDAVVIRDSEVKPQCGPWSGRRWRCESD